MSQSLLIMLVLSGNERVDSGFYYSWSLEWSVDLSFPLEYGVWRKKKVEM